MPYSLWRNPLFTHKRIRARKENAVSVILKTILTLHILQQGPGNPQGSCDHTSRACVLKDCYIVGPVTDKAILVCSDETGLKDELSPCGICPSPELKRHAFHTLSPEALSGRPLVSGKALQALLS